MDSLKKIKIISATILMFVIIFAFAGCGKAEGQPDLKDNEKPVSAPAATSAADETENITDGTEGTEVLQLMTPLEEYGLTIENIQWSNMMMYLLNRHSSVKVVRYEDDIKYVEGYFNCDDRVADIFATIHPDGTMEASGFFDRFIWELQDGRVVARTYVEYLNDEYYAVADSEGAVNYYFMDAQAAVISADDSTYTLYVHNILGDYTITLDRNNLDILRIEGGAGLEEGMVVEYIYDQPVEGSELFDGWNGDKKQVTFVAEMYSEEGVEVVEKTFEAAPDWEIVPDSWQEIALYGNAEYTAEYRYPGSAQDYTVYITNAMG